MLGNKAVKIHKWHQSLIVDKMLQKLRVEQERSI